MKWSGAFRKCSLNNLPTVSDCGAHRHNFSPSTVFFCILSFFHRFVYRFDTRHNFFSHYFSSHVIRPLMICRTLAAHYTNVCINILWEMKKKSNKRPTECLVWILSVLRRKICLYFITFDYHTCHKYWIYIIWYTNRNNKSKYIGLFKCLQGLLLS